MSLIINRKIKGDVQLGVWKIEESIAELLQMLNLTPMEERIFESFGNDERRKQWLSYRVTIKKLLNLNKVLDINYDRYGKPKILNHYLHISVSHSGVFSAAILHKRHATGIDIERLSKRIYTIKDKFLSPQELRELPEKSENMTEILHVYWGAKEAIYKIQSLGSISLREHIYVSPFDVFKDNIINANLNYLHYQRQYKLHFERIDDYLLVYSVDEPSHDKNFNTHGDD
ncbi:MAG: 4'-phosphopantetheinyl transferase family protein [Bacteroidota bacterium]